MSRPVEDYNHDKQMLDAAHVQNEAGRDAFVALAHTALFAASIAFVGEVTHLTDAILIPILILGWAASVVGLLALTFSFAAARRAIDAHRKALNDDDPPKMWIPETLNAIALWSFPVSLLCLFSFVTANVVHANGRQTVHSTVVPGLEQGAVAPAPSALPQSGRSLDGRHPGSSGTVSPAAASAKEVAAKKTR